MSLRTPIGRAKGLGSAKSGVHHWLAERISAAALVPLVVYFIIGFIGVAGADYAQAAAWLGNPVNAVLMILLLIVGFHHAQLGMQVVFEDYTGSEWVKIFSIVITKFIAYALAAAGSFAVLKIALGA